MTEDKILPLDRWPDTYRKIPYGRIKTGYSIDPDNPLHIIPNPEHIFWIEKGFDYLDAGSSLREVADWLAQKIFVQVTHQTFSNLYKVHRKPFLRKKTNRRTHVPHTRETKKIISAKVQARTAAKKADELVKKAQEKKKKLQPEDFTTPRESTKEYVSLFKDTENRTTLDIIFKPNPGPQEDFLRASEFQVLYGGSAGGGKSYAMLADPMRYFSNPNFIGLLLRRTNDELKELIRESRKLYAKAFPGAVWREKDSMWRFPSGAEFWMSYLDRDEDVSRYQGQSFCWVGIDELTQYATPFAWNYMSSRVRSTDPILSQNLSMRATTNPGGPGHLWVKKMFVDPEVPNKAFWATDIDSGDLLVYPSNHRDPEKAGMPLFKRRFIPAKLSDNPYLYEDGVYERALHGLPENERRKLLEGDWSVMEGAAFTEFSPKHHVIEPYKIPTSWRRFRAGDFGYSSHSAILWFAIDPMYETLIVYRELYVSKKTGAELAQLILEAEQDDNISYGVLDSSVWHQRGHWGPSIAEEMIAQGCRWRPSDRGSGSRIAGKNRLHELLKVDEEGRTGIQFFNTCRQIIADLPMLPADPNGGEDIDSRYKSDHTYDALRYGIMSRPRSGPAVDWGRQALNNYQPVDKVFGY